MSTCSILTYHIRQAVLEVSLALLPQVIIEEDPTRFCRILFKYKNRSVVFEMTRADFDSLVFLTYENNSDPRIVGEYVTAELTQLFKGLRDEDPPPVLTLEDFL